MDLFPLPRLGVVVPPENPTAEPEFNHLLGSAANVYTARFPLAPGLGLRDTLDAWNQALPDTLAAFGGLRLDAAVVACSASHYLLGPDGDRAVCAELSQRFGFPVHSSTQATLAACAALGVTRLTLVSPYQPWLTDTSAAFWERAGLTVDDVVLVAAGRTAAGEDAYDPYLVTADRIRDRIAAARLGRGPAAGAALLFTGTGMGTLTALAELAEEEPGRVLLSSNLASAWWSRQVTGVRDAAHPLLARLDTVVGRAA